MFSLVAQSSSGTSWVILIVVYAYIKKYSLILIFLQDILYIFYDCGFVSFYI